MRNPTQVSIHGNNNEHCKACNQEHKRNSCPVVNAEVAARATDAGFIAYEYKRHRFNGLTPEQIDYDMCHVWR